jgi:hypothetical protein
MRCVRLKASRHGTWSQAHVGKFADLLFFEIYKHYGKSVRDEHLTIEQLREKGREFSGAVTLENYSRQSTHTKTGVCQLDK